MGSSSNESNSLIVCNMKYLAILAIALFAVVAAEPEADADAAAGYYGGYRGYYGGYYGYPYRYGAYGYAHHALGKRSADAEAEADPAYLYAGAYGYPYAYSYPYGYGYRAFAPYYAASASHQHVSTPAATYGISQLHKRSADAEPEADAAAAYYGGYYGHPGYGYYGLGYGYGRYYGGYGYGRFGYYG